MRRNHQLGRAVQPPWQAGCAGSIALDRSSSRWRCTSSTSLDSSLWRPRTLFHPRSARSTVGPGDGPRPAGTTAGQTAPVGLMAPPLMKPQKEESLAPPDGTGGTAIARWRGGRANQRSAAAPRPHRSALLAASSPSRGYRSGEPSTPARRTQGQRPWLDRSSAEFGLRRRPVTPPANAEALGGGREQRPVQSHATRAVVYLVLIAVAFHHFHDNVDS